MRLVYLRPNQAWAILFGGQLIDLDGQRLFETRDDAMRALRYKNLVASKAGVISASHR